MPPANSPLASPSLSQASFSPRLSKSSSCSFQPLQIIKENRIWAEELMSYHSSRSDGAFSYKEATAVLSDIADGVITDATPGLVRTLLDAYDADVCFQRRKSNNLLKKMINQDQLGLRSNLLQNATRNCSDQMLLLLAQKADEVALNQALPIAIMQVDQAKVEVLLARGADASPLCDEFLNVIERCSDQFLSPLLIQVRGVCQKCRDQALVRMAAVGHQGKVAMLLRKSANVAHDKAAALREAIRNRRPDIANAIVAHPPMRGHQDLLDLAVGDAYDFDQTQTLKMCLQAGAVGPKTGMTLLSAVEKEQWDLANLIIQYGSSLGFETRLPITLVVMRGQIGLLKAILGRQPTKSVLEEAIIEATKLNNIPTAHHIIDLLLTAGLRGDAVSETLVRVLNGTTFATDDHSRCQLVHLLLSKGDADVNIKGGRSLVQATEQGFLNILKLLVQYRPSMESLQAALASAAMLSDADFAKASIATVIGAKSKSSPDRERLLAAAVVESAKSHRMDLLECLSQYKFSPTTILAGFAALTSTGTGWASPSGLPVVQFLLDQGASGRIVDKAFSQAVLLLEFDAVNLLSTSIGPRTLSEALRGLVEEHSQRWMCPDNRYLWVIHFLLEWGARGEPVDLALLYAVQGYVEARASEELLDTLLVVGRANVNFRFGEALKIAVRYGNPLLLQKLASYGANKEVLTHTFSDAIMSPLDEDVVISLINTLATVDGKDNRPDFRAVSSNGYPPVANCLCVHPEAAKLIRRLAELGCNIDAIFEDYLYDVLEPVTPLAWAMCPREGRSPISPSVIEALIKAKAPASQTTPLILAAQHGRDDAVSLLLKAEADSYRRDCFDRSALFYASEIGALDSIRALLKAKFKVNDGSLHEAARNLHAEAVALLVKYKHDVNFPSTAHDGRTPIQEMAYGCDGTRNVMDIELTIEALEKGKVDFLGKWRGRKNALFLALDNPQPCAVTQALLEKMWSVLNHEDNVFEAADPHTRVRYFMSPTIYLAKHHRHDDDDGRELLLLRLLQAKQCQDRFYAELGAAQPAGAVGLPDAVAKADKRRRDEEEKRRARQREHDEKMRHDRDKLAQKMQQSAAVLHHTQMHQQGQMRNPQQQQQQLQARIPRKALAKRQGQQQQQQPQQQQRLWREQQEVNPQFYRKAA